MSDEDQGKGDILEEGEEGEDGRTSDQDGEKEDQDHGEDVEALKAELDKITVETPKTET